MNHSNRKQLLFKSVDRITAVLSSCITAVFLSALIFLVLSEWLGHTRVIAVITRMFPSRELQSVTLLLVMMVVLGAITMWSFSDNKLSFLVVANGIMTVAAALFFLYYTALSIFIAVAVLNSLYLVLGIVRFVLLMNNYDAEDDENDIILQDTAEESTD